MLDYLPPIMRTYAEFQQISKAEQMAKEQMWSDIDKLYAEGYVISETEIGAARWEKTLGIIPKDDEDIEVRNFRIRGLLQRDLPYTYRTLKKQLTGLCGENGFNIALNFDESSIEIKVALTRKELRNEVAVLADEIIPAHMLLIVELWYNTHGMINRAGVTYGELAAYTYGEVRESPFE